MELRKNVASLALAALMISQVGTTMIPIFEAPPSAHAANNTVLPDALYQRVLQSLPSNMPSTLTIGFGNPWTVIGETNTKLGQFGLTTIPVSDQPGCRTGGDMRLCGGAVRNDGTTTRAVCNLFGYESVTDTQSVWSGDGRSNFTSCGNNSHGVWGGSDMSIVNSCGGNWASSITCGTPLRQVTQCNDGLDNDSDGAVDLQDFSCGNNPARNDETNPKAKCQDLADNDNDQLIDFPEDPGCMSKQDDDEGPQNLATFSGNKTADVGAVRPGGFVVYTVTFQNTSNVAAPNVRIVDSIPGNTTFEPNGSTAGCSIQGTQVTCPAQSVPPGQSIQAFIRLRVDSNASCGIGRQLSNNAILQKGGTNQTAAQTSTIATPIDCAPLCQNGIDDDGDGAIDLADFSCGNNPNRSDETNPRAQCQDQQDNDNDGLIDTQDPRCHTDNNPNNPGSYNPQDNDEFPADHPQLTVTKTADLQSARQNDTITYTIQIRNDGQVTQQNIRVTDAVPGNVTYIPNGSSGGCVQQGASVFCPAQSITPNQTITTILKFRVNQTAQCGGSNTVSNRVSVQQNNVQIGQSNQAQTPVQCSTQCSDGLDNDGDGMTDTQDPGCQNPNDDDESDGNVDLDITLTAPATAMEGQTITYTATVRNNGPDSATRSFSFRSPIPNGLRYVQGSGGQSCAQVGSEVICSGITLRPNTDRTFTLTYEIPRSVATELNVFQKLFGVRSAVAAHLCGPLTNEVILNPVQPDPNPTNNRASKTTTVNCEQRVDLSIEKRATSNTVVRGELLDYQIIIRNAGPDTAQNVIVTDRIPAGLSGDDFDGSRSPGCVLNAARTSVLCNNGNGITLPANQSHTVHIVFRVPHLTNCGPVQPIQNTASVGSTGVEQNDTDNNTNRTPTSTTVQCPVPAFRLTLTPSVPFVSPGDFFGYTINATNIGSSTQTVYVSDPIPTGLEFTAAGSTGGCEKQGNVVVCTPQTVAPNQTLTAVLRYKVSDTFACNQEIRNIVDLKQGNTVITTSDPSVIRTFCPQPEFSGTKTANVSSVLPGGTVRYAISIRNDGSTVQQNVRVSDTVPSDLQFIPTPGSGCTEAGGVVTCQAQNFVSGQPAAFTLEFRVKDTTQCSGGNAFITNRADLQQNGVTFTSLTPAQTRVDCPPPVTADLDLQKTGPASSQQGAIITYELRVSNLGPATATNVVVHDIVPNGFVYQSATGAQCGTEVVNQRTEVRCAIGSLTTGSPTIIQLRFTTPTPLPFPQCATATAQNEAYVTSTNDPVITNDRKTFQTTMTCPEPQTADVSIVKSGPSIATRGTTVRYEFFISNAGPAVAQNVSFFDQIPSGLTFSSASGAACGIGQNGRFRCTLPNATIASGDNRTASLNFTVDSMPNCTQPQMVTNSATVETTTPDTSTQNNTSTKETRLDCPAVASANLSLQKFGPLLITRGGRATYSFIVTNFGPDAAQNVVIDDPITPDFTLESSSGAGCSASGSTKIICRIPELGSGQSSGLISVTFNVATIANCSSVPTITNTATVRSSTADPVSGNNTSQAVTPVQCPVETANLSITKTGNANAVRGGTIAYNIKVENAGPGVAQNVSFKDIVPSGFTLASASGASCTEKTDHTEVNCALDSLAANTDRTVTLVFNVPQQQGCTQPQNVTNSVTLTSTTPDPDTSRNSSQIGTQVNCALPTTADLEVTKTGSSSIVRGSTIDYRVTIKNLGPAVAQNVTFTDTFPQGFTPLFFVGATCTSSSQSQLNCSLSESIPVGVTKTVTVRFMVPTVASCFQTTVTNTVTASSSLSDPVQTNNTAQTQPTTVICSDADLSVTKTGPLAIARGNTAIYTVVVINNGPSTLPASYTVTDTIPQGLTFNAQLSSTNCSVPTGSTAVTCTGSVGYGPGPVAVPLTIAFTVPTQATCTPGVTFTNSVTLTSPTDSVTNNNTAQAAPTTITCPIAVSNLSLQKTRSVATVQRGSTIAYTLTVTNAGPDTAQNVIITDPFPADQFTYNSFSFNPAVSGASCTATTSDVRCTVPSLLSGQSVAVTLTFGVKASTGTCSTVTVTNTASVQSDAQDPVSTNNTSETVSAQLTCLNGNLSDITVTKTDNTTTTSVNQRLRYSIILTNNSSQAVTGIRVTDDVPSQLGVVSGTISDSGTVSGQRIEWTNVTVNANSSRTLTFDADVLSSAAGATVVNTARVEGGNSGSDNNTFVNYLTVNPPPPPPPPFYNPPPPPIYYNPPPPPFYYNPPPAFTPPPFFSPPPAITYQPPSVVLPLTGARDGTLYTKPEEDQNLVKAKAQDAEEAAGTGFQTMVVVTLLTILAVGSAAVASKMAL